MTHLETSPALLEAIRKASVTELTADEVRRQRVSFVMGTLKDQSSITRDRVEEVLAKQDGRLPA